MRVSIPPPNDKFWANTCDVTISIISPKNTCDVTISIINPKNTWDVTISIISP